MTWIRGVDCFWANIIPQNVIPKHLSEKKFYLETLSPFLLCAKTAVSPLLLKYKKSTFSHESCEVEKADFDFHNLERKKQLLMKGKVAKVPFLLSDNS